MWRKQREMAANIMQLQAAFSDRLRRHLEEAQAERDAALAEVARLTIEVERAHLALIEAQNPGIDMGEVRAARRVTPRPVGAERLGPIHPKPATVAELAQLTEVLDTIARPPEGAA